MADKKIQMFRLAKKYFKTMGVDSLQSNRPSPLNIKNLLFFLFLTICFVDGTIFLIFRANSIIEYGLSFYMSITQFSILFVFSTVLLKVTKIFELIDDIDEFIETSECRERKREGKNGFRLL